MAENPTKPSELAKKLNNLLDGLSKEEKIVGAESLKEEIERNNFESEKAFKEEAILTAKHHNKTLKNRNKLFKQNIDLRKKYAHRIFILTCVWIGCIALILGGVGANNWTCFYLSDKVIITLITTTTINLYGFFYLVVKYLFPSHNIEHSKEGSKPK